MIDVEVVGVTKVFASEVPCEALKGVSIHVGRGQMHGLIGPEGAGKTTLLRVMTQLLKPTSGHIAYSFLEEKNCSFEKIKPYWAYMPQTQSLYPDLSVGEHLDFFRSLYDMSEEDFERKKAELLYLTRLSKFVDRPAGKLSGGMYKKLGLMCSLLRDPKMLILDEPTNGVDPISRREFWELLHHLKGITMIVATAYMDEAERCENIFLLDGGQLMDCGEPQHLLEKNKVRDFNAFFIQRARSADA